MKIQNLSRALFKTTALCLPHFSASPWPTGRKSSPCTDDHRIKPRVWLGAYTECAPNDGRPCCRRVPRSRPCKKKNRVGVEMEVSSESIDSGSCVTSRFVLDANWRKLPRHQCPCIETRPAAHLNDVLHTYKPRPADAPYHDAHHGRRCSIVF